MAMKLTKIIKRARVDKPDKFRLADHDPADICGLAAGKEQAEALLAAGIKRLTELQERLYAQDRWAVLAIFQGMDAAGKDSLVKHVMSGVNPQGCEVHAFKAPSAEELAHDFLWRAVKVLPERGHIGIFNRSYYEDVLVVRLRRELLAREKLPKRLVSKDIWEHRFKDIRAFERHLAREGIVVLKFFLHVSKEEQRRRFLERLDDPAKRWKFSMDDIAERKRWDRYMDAYQDMIRATSHGTAPWYVVPADHKWVARAVVAATLVEAMERLDLQFPKVAGAALAELAKVRKALVAEASEKRRKSRR
jgi:PPK2 family polyphosphate:nucleotide phosphotransferase